MKLFIITAECNKALLGIVASNDSVPFVDFSALLHGYVEKVMEKNYYSQSIQRPPNIIPISNIYIGIENEEENQISFSL